MPRLGLPLLAVVLARLLRLHAPCKPHPRGVPPRLEQALVDTAAGHQGAAWLGQQPPADPEADGGWSGRRRNVWVAMSTVYERRDLALVRGYDSLMAPTLRQCVQSRATLRPSFW